jgi:hypothetical protein
MRFISDGDFIFPFQAYYYNVKHLFLWAYQSGTANPDGIIRLPGRALYLLVFSWFGNIAVGYFFLASSLALVFAAFYYFTRVFFRNAPQSVSLLCALFFTFNPIFLGNLAKVGLILAAAMLPASLAVISRAFERRRLRYLLLWIVFMNISLIHPFTFTVNFLVTLAYFAYQCSTHRVWARQQLGKFVIIGFTALLLNAYFILPIASMGTVSKDALSSDVTATPVNYTSLVDVSNTGDIFTGLSLSKNVLKDFEFYSPVYQNFYFLGAFTVYVILLGIYLRVERRIGLADKKRFGVFLVAFLVLVLLATVKLWHIDSLIKLVIGLPGGWMFRSPLKWQLYIPLVLFGMLALVLSHVTTPWRRRIIYTGLAVSFILMNGFIMANIYSDLLRPRQVSTFQSLASMPLDHQNLLIVGNDRCFSFADNNPHIMTELNQILISKTVQVKQVALGEIDTINLDGFSYILGCQNTLATIPTDGYKLALRQQFANGAFQLYQNTNTRPYISTAATIFAVDQPRSLNDTAAFASKALHTSFAITEVTNSAKKATVGSTSSGTRSAAVTNATGLQDLFDKLDFTQLKNGAISTSITPIRSGKQSLYLQRTSPLYYKQTGNDLSLSATQLKGYKLLTPTKNSQQQVSLNLMAGQDLNITYKDPAYSYINLIGNPSLEKGSWQKDVGDCYSYDTQPDLRMSIITDDASEGRNSLQLQARHHIACTGPNEVAVKAGQHYLLSFDYKNIGGQYGGYYINFDDPNQTVLSGRLKGANKTWEAFTRDLTIPDGAKRMRVVVYGYPDGSGATYGTVRYDHFQLTAIPDVQGQFHLVSSPAKTLTAPKGSAFVTDNPAKNTIHITGASTPFYLNTHESYNNGWRLSGLSPAAAQHFKLNGSMNGWLIDPVALCNTATPSNKCAHQSNGSYDFTLTMEFAPQRLVYVGGYISGIAAMGAFIYFVIDTRNDQQARRFWKAKVDRLAMRTTKRNKPRTVA